MGRKKQRNPEYRILATGDRNWAAPEVTDKVMNDYVARYPSHRMKVIEGGAKGADAAAADWAARNKVKHVQVKADWAKHHRAAGPIRNKRMLDEHDPDAVVGFHDDISRSKGTANMLNLAMKDLPRRQRNIELYNSKGEVRQMARNEPSKRRAKVSKGQTKTLFKVLRTQASSYPDDVRYLTAMKLQNASRRLTEYGNRQLAEASRRAEVQKSLADLGVIAKAQDDFAARYRAWGPEKQAREAERKSTATATLLATGAGAAAGAGLNKPGLRLKGAGGSAAGSALLTGGTAMYTHARRRKRRMDKARAIEESGKYRFGSTIPVARPAG